MSFRDLSEHGSTRNNEVGASTHAFENYSIGTSPLRLHTLVSHNYEASGETKYDGINYVAKRFRFGDYMIDGHFPSYDSKCDVMLPKSWWGKNCTEKIAYCNEKLEQLVKKEKIANEFSQDELQQIRSGKTPEGYIWHYDVEPGKMQLVKKDCIIWREIEGRDIWADAPFEINVSRNTYHRWLDNYFSGRPVQDDEYGYDEPTVLDIETQINIYGKKEIRKLIHDESFTDNFTDEQFSYIMDRDKSLDEFSPSPYHLVLLDPTEKNGDYKLVLKRNPEYLSERFGQHYW